jgi:hypothetical protein
MEAVAALPLESWVASGICNNTARVQQYKARTNVVKREGGLQLGAVQHIHT